MTRDLAALAATPFDLLVVGGGIYGATIAWEAAERGLATALIDRGDFGGATSFNSLKTVHGGLRSLQRANIAEMRQFIRERRTLLRIAPHLVAPLRFVLPTLRTPLTRTQTAMRAALAINDLIARDRNDGLDPARMLPPSRVIERSELLHVFPGADRRDVTGGAAWYDAQMYSTDRVLLAFVQSAAARGAAVANYVGATGFVRDGSRVLGAHARDELTGSAFEIRARTTVNAAGGWAPALTASVLAGRAPQITAMTMSKAMNVVTRLPAPSCALGSDADGQVLFCVPWRGVAVFGTWHAPHQGSADTLAISGAELDEFVRQLKIAFPQMGVRREAVTLVHRGLLPAAGVDARGHVQLLKESVVRDHAPDGSPGLMTVVGVRYTTARHTAEQAVDVAAASLGRAVARSGTATTPLVGGDVGDVTVFFGAAQQCGLPADACDRLARTYGTEYSRVVALIDEDRSLAQPLGATCGITRGEVLHAVRHEMAMRVSDAIMRRTDAGSAAHPGQDALASAAAIMGGELGWGQDRIKDEIADVERRYQFDASVS